MGILQSRGYKSLLSAVEYDEKKDPGFHDYRGKLKWILDRAAHYAEKTGVSSARILNAWEKARIYWYMNSYQEANQPEIKGDHVRVFRNKRELNASLDTHQGFRCPMCGGASKNPTRCDTGLKMSGSEKTCDWAAFGLFGTMGKGVTLFMTDSCRMGHYFMPVSWETA